MGYIEITEWANLKIELRLYWLAFVLLMFIHGTFPGTDGTHFLFRLLLRFPG